MLFVVLVRQALEVETLRVRPLPPLWQELKVIPWVQEVRDTLWTLDVVGNKLLWWDLKTDSSGWLEIKVPDSRIHATGFYVGKDSVWLFLSPQPRVLVYKKFPFSPLDTLNLVRKPCPAYPLAQPLPKPGGGLWLYSLRGDTSGSWDHWLHLYAPDGRYLGSFFPADNYSVAAGIERHLGILAHSACFDEEGGIFAVEMTSFRVWHFSKDGLLLEVFGEPPKGWRLPRPRRALEKGKPASWDAGSTLFTDCFRLGPYLLVQFMRVKEEGDDRPSRCLI